MSLYYTLIKKASPSIHALMISKVDPETKYTLLKSGMNNTGRNLYSSIRELIPGIQGRHAVSNRQLFKSGDKVMGFTVTADASNAVCRQYYEDYNGFYCYSVSEDAVFKATAADVAKVKSPGLNLGNEKLSAVSLSIPFAQLTRLTEKQFLKEINADTTKRST